MGSHSNVLCRLHAITAYLVARGVTVGNHDDRSTALADPRNGVPIHDFRAYQALRRRSVDARYLVRTFTANQVRSLIDDPLHEVFRFVGL